MGQPPVRSPDRPPGRVQGGRLNRSRSDDLFEDVVEVSRTAANIKIRSQSEFYKQLVFSQSSMYLLLAAVVFMVPAFSDTKGGSITQVTTALMFVVGVCMGIVQTIPVLLAADVASDNIERLEARLRAIASAAQVDTLEPRRRFDKIEMRNVVFSYKDKSSEAVFRVGPLDFTLRSGDLVFITRRQRFRQIHISASCSLACTSPIQAKSCLMGCCIDDTNRDAYRALIAAIFVDYHLFQRLYGITDPDPGEVDRLLTQFRLLEKTRLGGDGEFSTLDLSGGQRKRSPSS